MPAQHPYKAKQIALAIALALGHAEFSNAQPPSLTEAFPTLEAPVLSEPQPDAEPFARLAAFLNADTTFARLIHEPEDSFTGTADNELVGLIEGGSVKGLIDGGGNNLIQLRSPAGGVLGETRNFNGLYVTEGAWTLTGKGDFKEGILVEGGDLTNEGAIEGGAVTTANLLNKGSIKGDVHVTKTGTFAGAGSVGELYVAGRLNVDRLHGAPRIERELILGETAVLAYEVTPDGHGETIKVAGTANLGDSTLKIVAVPGEYSQNRQYTVIQANEIVGRFGTIENSLAFMTPEVKYEKKTVELTYARNDVSIESVALTDNGRELGRSIEEPTDLSTSAPQTADAASTPTTVDPVSAPSTSPATTSRAVPRATVATSAAVVALLDADKKTASSAIEQLAGGSIPNLAKLTLNSDAPVSATMLAAMRQLDGAASFGSRKKAPRLAAGSETGGRVWFQALGHGGKLDRDVDNLKHSTRGLVMGTDWAVDEEWRIGLIGGKSQTRMDSRELDGDLDSWHVGAYALRQSGPMSLRLGATYSNHDGSTKRRVAFKGFSDRLEGQYDSSTQQAFAEVGYNLGRENVSIEPFAGLGYQRYHRDAYTEKGGSAALKVDAQEQNNLNSTFGLRLAKINSLDNGMQLTPRFSASWKHTFGEIATQNRQRLITAGRKFTVSGAPLDRDSLMVEAGLELGLSARHTLGVGVTGEMASDSRNHGATAQWRMTF
ncbi:autotransporter domain-containing protein [Pseudomonas sp. P1.8]|uniref:autotransporter outer membrane beta-barrel domain-containing protein n=1 Tax=Pseudomonas sp. P1.8 TaxID=1699310 RepID=UPI00069D2637|nr:autotransporter domain-containing protein [Pseudomonas sp. P1.8]